MNQAPSAARWSTAAATIRLQGPDALRVLHGQSSQDIALARPGSCLATCMISPTARMRALALVLVDEDDSGMPSAELVVIAGDGKAVHQALDRVLFPADQVELGAVQAATLVRFIGAVPADTPEAEGLTWLRPGVNLGSGDGAEDGTTALLLREGTALPDELAALPELTAAQAEAQRVRQGFPAMPNEANDDTNPFELGLAPWVSLSKGCYVGQETLAKLATYGGVKQQLRHWQQVTGDGCTPTAGSTLVTANGERAGVITTALPPLQVDGGGASGLALVRRQALGEERLHCESSDGPALRISVPPAFVAPPGQA